MADSHDARRRGWLALAVVFGCGGGGPSHSPEDDARSFAEAICSAAQECKCAPAAWSEPCEEHHVDLFLAAIERGSKVEREAFDDFLAEIERDPCLASAEWAAARQDAYQLQGERAEGEACTRHPALASLRVNECAEGLVCLNGACVDETVEPALLPLAECVPEPPDESCGNDLVCGLDGTCVQRSGDGAACDSAWTCFGPSYCAGAAPGEPSICRPALDLGDVCEPLEFRHCGHETVDGVKLLRWCDGRTMRCEEGRSLLCDALNDPVNW
jgi:hypothetical protein